MVGIGASRLPALAQPSLSSLAPPGYLPAQGPIVRSNFGRKFLRTQIMKVRGFRSSAAEPGSNSPGSVQVNHVGSAPIARSAP